jgi:hypothetical protein
VNVGQAKTDLSRLLARVEVGEDVLRSGLRILGLAPDHGLAVADLPMHYDVPVIDAAA